jgi:hypothetical protein
MSRAKTKTLVLVALSFCCGAIAMRLWSAWQFKTATSCEALLSQQHIPNPFQLTGNNCAVMDVSKGYRSDEPTTFPPESTAVWRGRAVKVLGRNGNAVVVQDCPKCVASTSWIGVDAQGREVVKTAPEVP